MVKNVQGFTMLEFIVVIGIIGMIAAIILPVLSRAKENGRQATCLGNLRELGTGMRMYADDYDGRLPDALIGWHEGDNPNGNWAGGYEADGFCEIEKGQIYPYIKSAGVFLCPSDVGSSAHQISGPAAVRYPLSYAMNYMLGYQNLDADVAPANRVGLLLHENRWTIGGGGFLSGPDVGFSDLPSDAHFGGTCVLYCDLHGSWKKFDDVMQAVSSGAWDPAKP
jgi:general secretion pathway protein G